MLLHGRLACLYPLIIIVLMKLLKLPFQGEEKKLARDTVDHAI